MSLQEQYIFCVVHPPNPSACSKLEGFFLRRLYWLEEIECGHHTIITGTRAHY